MMTNYDDLPYLERPFRQTHPDRLASMGLLLGMTPADPATARVLDVGCGSALNIIAMAAALPDARFFGFDLAQTAVTQAQSRIAQLGMRNVRVEHLDLMNFPPDAGEFDFIVAHGFYSWVPEPVREALLALMNRHASPNAICYLSFNARPGSTLRLAWREAAAFHAQGIEDTVERARASVRMLELMAEASAAKSGAWQDIVGDMVGMVHDKGLQWVGHDDFGPVFEPFHFHEVADAAARHGMQYLSEACYFDGQPYELGDAARGILQSLEDRSVLLREQYFDFLELRSFRQILLCRSSVELRRLIDNAGLPKMSFSSPADESAVTGDGNAIFSNPLTGVRSEVRQESRIVLQQLRKAWPCSVPFAQVVPDEPDREAIARLLERLWACALVEAHAVAQRCGCGVEQRPVASPLARLEAAAGETVTTRIHSQCILDAGTHRLLRLLDGSRDRSDLAELFPDLQRRLDWLARMGLLEPTNEQVGS